MFFVRQCVVTWVLYLLTTFLCGTAAWIIWAMARKLLEGKGLDSVLGAVGRLAQWLYMLPLVQTGWAIYARVTTEFNYSFGVATPLMENVMLILAALWLLGFLWMIQKKISAVHRRNSICKSCTCSTGEQAELFRRACWRSGMLGEIRLYQGENVTAPFLRGIFVWRMYVPEGGISQEEMQEFLWVHRWNRRCAAAVKSLGLLINWYNPLVTNLYRWMEKYAEGGEEKGTKSIAKCRIWTGLLIAVQLSFVGFCVIQFLEYYTQLDMYTSNVEEVEAEESIPPQEYVTDEEELGITVEDDVVEIDDTEGTYHANWFICSRIRKQSPAIYGMEGEEIWVLVMGTEEVPFKFGILYEDGTRQYAKDQGDLCTTFTLRKSGHFRFFAQNDGDGAMDVSAIVQIKKK